MRRGGGNQLENKDNEMENRAATDFSIPTCFILLLNCLKKTKIKQAEIYNIHKYLSFLFNNIFIRLFHVVWFNT